jgi:hypothetical protein
MRCRLQTLGLVCTFVLLGATSSSAQKGTELGDPGTITGAYFGDSLSITSNRLAVGSEGDGVAVYTLSSKKPHLEAHLTAPHYAALITAVQLDSTGTTLATGDAYAMVNGASNRGKAYIFTRSSAGKWTQTTTLTVADGAAGDGFGASLAMSGTTLLVGAPGHVANANTTTGAVYVFNRAASGQWTQTAELTGWDPSNSAEEFGNSIAIDGNTLVAGAWMHSTDAFAAMGVAYVFS